VRYTTIPSVEEPDMDNRCERETRVIINPLGIFNRKRPSKNYSLAIDKSRLPLESVSYFYSIINMIRYSIKFAFPHSENCQIKDKREIHIVNFNFILHVRISLELFHYHEHILLNSISPCMCVMPFWIMENITVLMCRDDVLKLI